MNESEKQKRADARKKRKRRQMFIGRMIIVILLFIILGLCAFLGKDMLEKKSPGQPGAGSDPVLKVRVRQIPQARECSRDRNTGTEKRRRYHVSGRVKGSTV